MFDESSFFYLDESDNHKHMYKDNFNGLINEVTNESLARDYILLEEFLETSEYIGYKLDILWLKLLEKLNIF